MVSRRPGAKEGISTVYGECKPTHEGRQSSTKVVQGRKKIQPQEVPAQDPDLSPKILGTHLPGIGTTCQGSEPLTGHSGPLKKIP